MAGETLSAPRRAPPVRRNPASLRRLTEIESVTTHVDASPRKSHLLGFQPYSLLEPSGPRQRNASTGSHHTMPRQSRPSRRSQRPHYLPRTPRESGGFRNLSIRSHSSARDPPDVRT